MTCHCMKLCQTATTSTKGLYETPLWPPPLIIIQCNYRFRSAIPKIHNGRDPNPNHITIWWTFGIVGLYLVPNISTIDLLSGYTNAGSIATLFQRYLYIYLHSCSKFPVSEEILVDIYDSQLKFCFQYYPTQVPTSVCLVPIRMLKFKKMLKNIN